LPAARPSRRRGAGTDSLKRRPESIDPLFVMLSPMLEQTRGHPPIESGWSHDLRPQFLSLDRLGRVTPLRQITVKLI
jgi:hypothetical protein